MEAVGSVAAVGMRVAWGVLKKHMAARMENEVGFEQLRESLLGELESIKEDLHELRCRELRTALDHLESAYLIQQYYDPNDDVDKEQAVDQSAHARSVTAAGERAKWFFEETLRNARSAFGIVPDIDSKILATKASIVAAYHVHCGEPDVAKRLCIKFLRDLFSLPETVKLFDDFRDERQPGRRTSVRLKHLVPGQRQKAQTATRAIAAITDYVLTIAPHGLNEELCKDLGLRSSEKSHYDPWHISEQQRSIVLRKHTESATCLTMLKTRVLTGSIDKSLRVWGVNISSGEGASLRKIRAVPKDGFTALESVAAADGEVAMYAGHASGHISCWLLDEGQVARETYQPNAWARIAAHTHAVTLLAHHASRSYLFSAAKSEAVISCWDVRAELDDPDARRHAFSLDGHSQPVTGLAVDETRLYSCDTEGTVKVWLIGSELSACIQTISASVSPAVAIRACDGLLYCAKKEEVCVWSTQGKGPITLVHTLISEHCSSAAVALALNTEKMFIGLECGDISCWDLRFSPPRRTDSTLSGHTSPITCLMLYRAMLVAGAQDGSVRCYWLAG
eukprot:scpid59514/ scgid16159/ F-box/WD repeat-containing protein lin-23; Abnormal cell lineage protein 23